MEFFNTLHSRTHGLLLFVSCAILFPTIASCDDNISQNAEEVIAETEEDMTALTEDSMNTTQEVVEETAESLSPTEQTQAEQVIAEADTSQAQETTAADTAAATSEDKPYTVSADGKVDWYTFNGYRRYHAECHTCHGPAGLGSSFAPNLTESVKTLGYEGYLEVVVNGRQVVSTVAQQNMPSFATNMNVMCYVDDIYAYLVARADGVIGRERPEKEAKPEAAKERDNSCAG